MGKKILFIGSKDSGLACLKMMHEIAPELLVGAMTVNDEKDTRSVLDGFIDFSKKNNINLSIVSSRKESEQIIYDLKPDLCIVVGWYWILSEEILEIAKDGFIGIHNSMLPKFRGGAPLVWAILQGESKIGFSFFTFTKGMDDGPIWFQKEIDISNQMFIKDVIEKINIEILIAFKDIFPKILTNEIIPELQNNQLASYCALRIAEDGKINWNKTSHEIYNFIRAQSKPYPGAFTMYNNEKLKIWDADYMEMDYLCTPGQVISCNNDGVTIGCGNNSIIRIKLVEYEGKDQIAFKVLNSINIRL